MLNPKEADRLKKKLQAEFRRFITWKSSGKVLGQYLGVGPAELREWVESNFQPGMSWSNYGEVWVIDHIVPLRMFDLTNEDDLNICWHYKNLMPLFKIDNLKKEGNVFFSFELLFELRDKDFFYSKLFDKVWKEVDYMAKYIDHFHRRYSTDKPATVRSIGIKKIAI